MSQQDHSIKLSCYAGRAVICCRATVLCHYAMLGALWCPACHALPCHAVPCCAVLCSCLGHASFASTFKHPAVVMPAQHSIAASKIQQHAVIQQVSHCNASKHAICWPSQIPKCSPAECKMLANVSEVTSQVVAYSFAAVTLVCAGKCFGGHSGASESWAAGPHPAAG